MLVIRASKLTLACRLLASPKRTNTSNFGLSSWRPSMYELQIKTHLLANTDAPPHVLRAGVNGRCLRLPHPTASMKMIRLKQTRGSYSLEKPGVILALFWHHPFLLLHSEAEQAKQAPAKKRGRQKAPEPPGAHQLAAYIMLPVHSWLNVALCSPPSIYASLRLTREIYSRKF